MLTTKPHYIYAEKDCNGYYLNQNYIKKIESLENDEYYIYLEGEKEPYETTSKMAEFEACVHVGDNNFAGVDEVGIRGYDELEVNLTNDELFVDVSED